MWPWRFRILLLALLTVLARGAEPPGHWPLQGYSHREGLENQAIQCLAQGPDGQLWVGTQAGFFRFDGTRFRPAPLADRKIVPYTWRLLVTRRGQVWGSGERELYRWKDQAFEPVRLPDQVVLWGLAENDFGELLVACSGGLFLVDDQGKARRHPDFPWPSCGALARSQTGDLWAVTPQGLVVLRASGGVGGPLNLPMPMQPGVTRLLAEPSGRLWIRNPGQILVREPDGRLVDVSKGLPYSNPARMALGLMHGETVWAGTSEGPYAWREGHWESLKPLLGSDHRRLNCTVVDSEGSLWLGSSGALSMVRGGSRWESISEEDGLPNPTAWALLRSRSGRLWLGMEDGLAFFSDGRWQGVPGFPRNRVLSVSEAPDGSLWAGDNMGEVRRVSPAGRILETYTKADGLRGSATRCVLWDRQGRLWLGHGQGGVTRAVRRGSRWAFEPVPLPGGSEIENIRYLLEDRAGRIHVLGVKGWAILEGGTWRRFTTGQGLREDAGNALADLGNDRFALAYFNGLGVDVFHLGPGNLALEGHLGPGAGLLTGKVYALASDTSGGLWIGTGLGAAHLPAGAAPEAGQVRTYLVEDGLVNNDCMQNGILLEGDRVWIATSRGLSRVVQDRFTGPPARPRTLLHSVMVDQQARPLRGETLRLGRRERSLVLELGTLTFRDAHRQQREIRMEGLEDTWTPLAGLEARYPQLPPGTYRFHARSRLGEGPWGPELVLKVEVLPAWWQHAVTKFMALVLLAFLVATLVRHRLRRRLRLLQAQNHELDERVQAATQEVRQQHDAIQAQNLEIRAQNQALSRINEAKNQMLAIAAHDIRNPLNAIRLLAELAIEAPEECCGAAQRVLRLSTEASTMLQNLLELGQAEAGRLELERIPFDPRPVIARVVEAEQPAADRKGLAIQVEEIGPVSLLLADPLRLREVLQNLVSNALKFMPKGPPLRFVVIRVGPGFLEVKDEGPGFNEEDMARAFTPFTRLSARPTAGEVSTGLGLSIVKTMVEAMGGTLDLHSRLGDGATFTIRLPEAPGADGVDQR